MKPFLPSSQALVTWPPKKQFFADNFSGLHLTLRHAGDSESVPKNLSKHSLKYPKYSNIRVSKNIPVSDLVYASLIRLKIPRWWRVLDYIVYPNKARTTHKLLAMNQRQDKDCVENSKNQKTTAPRSPPTISSRSPSGPSGKGREKYLS